MAAAGSGSGMEARDGLVQRSVASGGDDGGEGGGEGTVGFCRTNAGRARHGACPCRPREDQQGALAGGECGHAVALALHCARCADVESCEHVRSSKDGGGVVRCSECGLALTKEQIKAGKKLAKIRAKAEKAAAKARAKADKLKEAA
ncbi:uncharacterized protein AMSG_07756 [Thecamonas trahens ATCC 50062]|uniref:Uncharacterized protein n=1 Tax=Thecamonas trahens ATCC 50062 TaxID=461836 RepID=A0A0L0DHA1_THETB|nr:hypothetical protein AMSG_07756 [Thecamonas trahens ATCC 50062]KNC51692.1 hypothetical protein AMSG_07756 [Thecamonas trahens ATCC 50062]|eukprot:XP_013755821.1 hypothetical protein AMSG_07756 [Thecamonas trahens ATCC 50062]